MQHICVHKTYSNWWHTIKSLNPDSKTSVAFWKPSLRNFSLLELGETILFNVDGKIVGGGIYREFSNNNITPQSLWNEYGNFTGAKNLSNLLKDLNEKRTLGSEEISESSNISYLKLSDLFWLSPSISEIFTKEFGDFPNPQNPYISKELIFK